MRNGPSDVCAAGLLDIGGGLGLRLWLPKSLCCGWLEIKGEQHEEYCSVCTRGGGVGYSLLTTEYVTTRL